MKFHLYVYDFNEIMILYLRMNKTYWPYLVLASATRACAIMRYYLVGRLCPCPGPLCPRIQSGGLATPHMCLQCAGVDIGDNAAGALQSYGQIELKEVGNFISHVGSAVVTPNEHNFLWRLGGTIAAYPAGAAR